jgi:uncharacterized Zn-binding protein involved in type VI secretion
MGKAVQRVGDQNTGGGVIINGDDSVLINGRAVAIQGSSVSPHPCCGRKGCPPVHCSAKTQTNNGTVLVNGIPLIFTDDIDTCGHARANGSADVSVG